MKFFNYKKSRKQITKSNVAWPIMQTTFFTQETYTANHIRDATSTYTWMTLQVPTRHAASPSGIKIW